MTGFAILLAFNFLGLAIKHFLSVPLPANVIGLILFIVSLYFKWIKLEWVEQTAHFLLRHLMLFFAPVIVATIAFRSVLGAEWLAVTAGLIVSTLLTLAVTGWVTEKFEAKEDRPDHG